MQRNTPTTNAAEAMQSAIEEHKDALAAYSKKPDADNANRLYLADAAVRALENADTVRVTLPPRAPSPVLHLRPFGRLPIYTDPASWARAMFEAGMSYHIDDDPAQIVCAASGVRTFTDAEAAKLRELTATMSPEAREIYFATSLECVRVVAELPQEERPRSTRNATRPALPALWSPEAEEIDFRHDDDAGHGPADGLRKFTNEATGQTIHCTDEEAEAFEERFVEDASDTLSPELFAKLCAEVKARQYGTERRAEEAARSQRNAIVADALAFTLARIERLKRGETLDAQSLTVWLGTVKDAVRAQSQNQEAR